MNSENIKYFPGNIIREKHTVNATKTLRSLSPILSLILFLVAGFVPLILLLFFCLNNIFQSINMDFNFIISCVILFVLVVIIGILVEILKENPFKRNYTYTFYTLETPTKYFELKQEQKIDAENPIYQIYRSENFFHVLGDSDIEKPFSYISGSHISKDVYDMVENGLKTITFFYDMKNNNVEIPAHGYAYDYRGRKVDIQDLFDPKKYTLQHNNKPLEVNGDKYIIPDPLKKAVHSA